MQINSKIFSQRKLEINYNNDTIKNEPMLFNCSAAATCTLGGSLTKKFLSELPPAWRDDRVVIDSRVHMLMPGWYPCIPGWHHDDVIRSRSDGQPNYLDETYRTEHIMLLVNADIAPTEFAVGNNNFEIPAVGRTIYKDWNSSVQKELWAGRLEPAKAQDCTMIHFDDRTWHRGTEAVKFGWRFFIRASRYWKKVDNSEKSPYPSDWGQRGYELSTRQNPRTNEVRKQVQIYMSEENAGW